MSTPSSTDKVTPTQEPITPAVPETPVEATPEADDYIRLNRKELAKEIDRLLPEDREFARIWNTKVGEHAAKRNDPRVTQAEATVTELKRELRRREVMAMDPKEIEANFESDREFALEYADLVHSKPPTAPAAPIDETPIIAQSWQKLRGWAAQSGLPEAKWQEIERKASDGEYTDGDEHWSSTLLTIQQEITRELAGKPIDPAATVNPNLVRPGPDSGGGDRTGAAGNPFPDTLTEFKKLSTDEQRAIYRSEGGQAHVTALMADPK